MLRAITGRPRPKPRSAAEAVLAARTRARPLVVAVIIAALAALTLAITFGVPSETSPPPQPSPTAGHPPASSSAAAISPESRMFGPSFDTRRAFCTFGHPQQTIADDVLSVRYPAGSSAQSDGPPYGGAQMCLPFAAGPVRHATLTYKVRFPLGFQFVKGGKLPGLYGGDEPFSGGEHNPNGWSLRLMWRTSGAAEIYAYTAATSGYGDEYGKGNFAWKADGQWHTVTEKVALNTPGAADGRVTLAYDSTTYITQNNLDITTTDTPVGGLFFSTFYGGNENSWAPSADMHVDFADFRASTE